ncbi:2-dehydropantoate 2-reductase [Robbsia sp. KACC 23696]|uniref:ketopantoate reductase family protein n=1 Tax=Robbsia sp. KACC 23696 TaxID=3149231 RepID=UPI00325AF892
METHEQGLNILVLGAGALGGYYGSRLLLSGKANVTFLVRPARAEKLEKNGLHVSSSLGDFQGGVTTVSEDSLSKDFDLVLLTCKSYDLDAAITSIAPAITERTVVLPLLNGLAVYDQLDHRFGRQHVMGGVSYIAASAKGNGDIVHMGESDTLIVGARHPSQEALVQRVHLAIAATPGIRALSENIEHDLWQKWAMLCAGAAATCLLRATIGEILQSDDGYAVIRALLDEVLRIARTSGNEISAEGVRKIEALLFDRKSAWAASMMRDIRIDAPKIEARAIVGDMISRGTSLGIDTPYLRVAYASLQAYQAQQMISVSK